jgi:phosphatidylglycerophosphatase A
MNKLKSFVVTFIATAAGSGFAPKAPGTAGTVVGVFIIYLTRDWAYSSQLVLWTILFFAGWWASWEWSKKTGAKDNQQIVIDEVLGYMLAMGMLPREGWILVTQFILFRIFDALKPPPIRQFDQWGKKFEIGAAQSLGIIVDDLLAGVVSLLVFYLLQYFMVQTGIKI